MWVFTEEGFIQTAYALASILSLRVRLAYLSGSIYEYIFCSCVMIIFKYVREDKTMWLSHSLGQVEICKSINISVVIFLIFIPFPI